MDVEEVMLEVVDAMDALHIHYLLVGSFSSNFYGVPRSTKDVDFVVELADRGIGEIGRRLGPRYSVQAQVSSESATGTMRHIIDVSGTAFQIEMFRLSDDLHDRERFARRVEVEWLNRRVWLPTAEDVIITKLRWLLHLRRNKDYDDALSVASVQQNCLDWNYIERWTDQHGTRNILDELRREMPSA